MRTYCKFFKHKRVERIPLVMQFQDTDQGLPSFILQTCIVYKFGSFYKLLFYSYWRFMLNAILYRS